MISVDKTRDWRNDGFARPTHVSYIVDSGVIIKGGLIFIEATSMFKHVRRNSEMVIAVATVSF